MRRIRGLPFGVAPLNAMKLLAIILILTGAFSTIAAEPAARPNFLVILADDLGYSDIGCYGGEIETPHLDRLAAGGLRFTQFYNTARCWPSRTAVMCGYYPQQLRADPPSGRLPAWARSLPQLLKPLGYRCYHSGKWHIPGAPKPLADAGFDRSYQLEDHNRNFHPRAVLEDDKKLPPVPPATGYYTTTAIAEHAIKCLREHASSHAAQPFFAYLAFTVPHFPLQAPVEDIAKYRQRYDAGWDTLRAARFERMKRLGIADGTLPAIEAGVVAPSGKDSDAALIGPGEMRHAAAWDSLNAEQRALQATKLAIHAAMVDRMDRETGRVIEQLQSMGAMENTVIFFLSDNGASAELLVRGDGHDRAAPPGSAATFLCLGPGGSTLCNTPFRRHKIWVHEGGIATPLIVHWPRGIAERGTLRHDPGHVIDLLPTLRELAGEPAVPAAGAPPFPGRSLVPAFRKDGSLTRECLFFHHQGNRALRTGDWKIVAGANGPWELYNLKTDRGESHNLAASHPDKLQKMASRWQQLQDEFVRQAGVSRSVPPAAK
jgi:arylsulfatase